MALSTPLTVKGTIISSSFNKPQGQMAPMIGPDGKMQETPAPAPMGSVSVSVDHPNQGMGIPGMSLTFDVDAKKLAEYTPGTAVTITVA